MKQFAFAFLMVGVFLNAPPSLVSAQFISVKSVPVATGDQFLLFPSQNMGMGGINIAVDDPLLDPFTKPSKKHGARRPTNNRHPGALFDLTE